MAQCASEEAGLDQAWVDAEEAGLDQERMARVDAEEVDQFVR